MYNVSIFVRSYDVAVNMSPALVHKKKTHDSGPAGFLPGNSIPPTSKCSYS